MTDRPKPRVSEQELGVLLARVHDGGVADAWANDLVIDLSCARAELAAMMEIVDGEGLHSLADVEAFVQERDDLRAELAAMRAQLDAAIDSAHALLADKESMRPVVEAAVRAVNGWRHQNESLEAAEESANANNALADAIDTYERGRKP